MLRFVGNRYDIAGCTLPFARQWIETKLELDITRKVEAKVMLTSFLVTLKMFETKC